MVFAFHIEVGEIDGVDLSGLSFILAMYTPGKMTEPDWTTALYVDERADPEQQAQLAKALSGAIGGPIERFRALTETYLGTKYVPITFKSDGQTHSVSVPNVMDFNVAGVVREGQTSPMRLEH